MHSFEEQEKKLEEGLERIANLHKHVDGLPCRVEFQIPMPIVPLSPLGIIGQDHKNMHFMPWDWAAFFTHMINCLMTISLKYPEGILFRLKNIDRDVRLHKFVPNRDYGQRMVPFTHPLYKDGQMNFLWSSFINKTIDWIHSYLFMEDEGGKHPDKSKLCKLEGDYVFIEHKWRQYFMVSVNVLKSNGRSYNAIYKRVIYDYELKVQSFKAQINIRKAWTTDTYLKGVLENKRGTYGSVLDSIKVHNSQIIYDSIEQQLDVLKQKRIGKVDTKSIDNALEVMKEKFNKRINVDTSGMSVAQKEYDEKISALQRNLRELGDYIEKDKKEIEQKVENLVQPIVTEASNIEWKNNRLSRYEKKLAEAKDKAKITRDTYVSFNKLLEAEIEKAIKKNGFRDFGHLGEEYYKKKEIGKVGPEVVEMEELIQEENKKAEEVFIGDRKALVLRSQEVDGFGEKTAGMMAEVMKDYEKFDEVHQKVQTMQNTIIVKAEEQIKKEYKLLVDRIIEAVSDQNARFYAIYTFERRHIISMVTSLVIDLNSIHGDIVEKSTYRKPYSFYSGADVRYSNSIYYLSHNHDDDRIVIHQNGLLMYNNLMTPYQSRPNKKTSYGSPFPCEYSAGFEMNQDGFIRALRGINYTNLGEIIISSQRGLIHGFEKIMKFIKNNGEVESRIREMDQYYRIQRYDQEDYGPGYIGRNSGIPSFHDKTLKWYNKYKNILR